MIKDLCFEIIESCPNNCKFCSSRSDICKKRIIDLDTFSKTVKYLYDKFGIEEISLSGGEPFLHPDILNMVKFTTDLGIRTVIFTSGLKRNCIDLSNELDYQLNMIDEKDVITRNKIIKMYDNYKNQKYSSLDKEDLFKLKEMGLSKIVFDYQAYTHDTDLFLMGKNEDMRASFIKSLVYAKSVGLYVDVHFIPMKPNYKEIPDILDMLEIGEIDNISLLKFVPQGRGLDNIKDLLLTDEEMKEFLSIVEENKNRFHGTIRVGIPLQENYSHKCTAGLSKLDIKFDGRVLPCPAFKEIDIKDLEKYGVKNINIYNNLEELVVYEGSRNYPLCKKYYNN